MKDVYETLYRKEADLARVRQEIESLKFAAVLLADDSSSADPSQTPDEQDKKPTEKAFAQPHEAKATGTDSPYPIFRQPTFWESLKGKRQ